MSLTPKRLSPILRATLNHRDMQARVIFTETCKHSLTHTHTHSHTLTHTHTHTHTHAHTIF